ncbi:MAG: 30S ribosomal protein S13 [Methanobacteriota archaeon]
MAEKGKEKAPAPEEEAKAEKADAKAKKDKKDEEEKPTSRLGPRRAPVPPDLTYTVRPAYTDWEGQPPDTAALVNVRGLGYATAQYVADLAGVSRAERIGNLSDADVAKLAEGIAKVPEILPPWLLNRRGDLDTGDALHIVSTDIDTKRRDDLNRLKKIQCYRGIRHQGGQKVRGQRTRSNGRTGLTVGVQRQKLQAAAAGAKKEEAGKAPEKKEKK